MNKLKIEISANFEQNLLRENYISELFKIIKIKKEVL